MDDGVLMVCILLDRNATKDGETSTAICLISEPREGSGKVLGLRKPRRMVSPVD